MSEALDYAKLFNSVPVPRFVVKPGDEGAYVFVVASEKAEEYFRLSQDKLFGKSFEEHMSRVQEILKRIEAANLKLKPEKCNFSRKEVTFLGHVVSRDGIKPSVDNIERVIKWKVPCNVTEVKSYLKMIQL